MYFSVIVPIYNTDKFLRECIDSITAQDFKDFELILTDDGSTDGCPAICDEYAAKFGNVSVIHKPNGGLVSARKAGVSAASGKYIINVDSDDRLEAGFLSEAYRICESFKPDVCSFAIKFFGSEAEEIEPEPLDTGLYSGDDMQKLLALLPLSPDMKHIHYFLWGKAFRRELLTESQLKTDERIAMGEDITCLTSVYLNSKSVYISDFTAYDCRCFDKSMSRSYKPSHFNDIALGAEAMLRYGGGKAYRASVLRYAVFMFFVIFAAAAEQGEKNVCRYAAEIKNGLFDSAFKEAEFSKITPKSKIAVGLLKKNRFRAAYYFLRLCGRLKGGKIR